MQQDARAGAGIVDLKRHEGWKPSTVAESLSYVEESAFKNRIKNCEENNGDKEHHQRGIFCHTIASGSGNGAGRGSRFLSRPRLFTMWFRSQEVNEVTVLNSVMKTASNEVIDFQHFRRILLFAAMCKLLILMYTYLTIKNKTNFH